MPETAPDSPIILITGAAGNLGSLLARHLIQHAHRLRLMVHKTPLPPDVEAASNVTPLHADLADPSTLPAALAGVDVVVHFAGILFAPRPEKFLPRTNTQWFRHLLEACIEAGVKRVILISFPHTEGPTEPEHPATGRIDREPVSVHARTRLEEERLLMYMTKGKATTPVILRLGMIYGRGILMIDAARRLARWRLLGVWKEPTWIHLISTADYLAATEAAIAKPGIEGIYNIGDDQPVTLQHFLDKACQEWNCPRPWRMPLWLIYTAAWLCELFALVFRTKSPLTRDFIRIGRVPYACDTRRMREELIPTLLHPTLESGLPTR